MADGNETNSAEANAALLEIAGKQLEDLRAEYDTATAAHDAAMAALKVEHDDALAKISELTGRLDDANAAVDTAKAEASAARSAARVLKGNLPPKLRKLGPMKPSLTLDDMRAAIATAGTVEIVFSDGRIELAGLEPVVIEGNAWRLHPLGLMLSAPVTVHGPAHGKPAFPLAGYALLLDGKAVAYTPRSDPIQVAPGTTYNLANDIYFAGAEA